MTTARYPAPQEVRAFLDASPDPAKPRANLSTLEALYSAWPYAKGLQLWEGYVFCDLLHQLGWARYNASDDAGALDAWWNCPWADCARGERLALGNLLQRAQAQQCLVLSPAVSELFTEGRAGLSEVLCALDDESSVLTASPSGRAYVLESRVHRTDGIYDLRMEFDGQTLFYVSVLPCEVSARLSTAQAFFQMGSAQEAASWMLRAAHSSAGLGLSDYARSFLDKALQLDPNNEAVLVSLENLKARGAEPTFLSRVVAERALLTPAPLARTAIRPEEPPGPDYPQLAQLRANSSQWSGLARSQDFHDWEQESPPLAMAQGQAMDALSALEVWQWWQGRVSAAQPVLLPGEWYDESRLDFADYEESLSRVRGVGLEEVGRSRADHRQVVQELVTAWLAEPEHGVSDELPFPTTLRMTLFGLSHAWQIPLLLASKFGQESSRKMAAWLRRLAHKLSAQPLILSEDAIWLYFGELEQTERGRARVLSELLNMSDGFESCFEPETVVRLGQGWIIPVPYTPVTG